MLAMMEAPSVPLGFNVLYELLLLYDIQGFPDGAYCGTY